MAELRPGMQVVHPLFGAGRVRAVSGTGSDARITVDFAANVGQKKLQAGVARLTIQGESGDSGTPSQTAPAPAAAWYESLEVICEPKPGRRSPRQSLHDEIRAEAVRHDFWTEIRDSMRSRGAAPKVLDTPSGEISISTSDWLTVRICIRHRELPQANQRILAEVIFQQIRARLLNDFENFKSKPEFGIQGELIDADLVALADQPLEALPDRAPRRNPLPVRPKGVITNRPRRRDDY